MTNCSAEMDIAIAKLHQNFQELRYHLEKAFLEEGRALLKFEAQWNDLRKEGRKDLAYHEDNLQRMGISMPSIGTEAATSNLNAPLRSNATANPSAILWSNTNVNPNVLYWSNTFANPNASYWSSARPSGNGTSTPRPSGNGTLKFHCDVCNINCDTKAVLDKHKQGKKHMANLDKLKGKYVPGQSSTGKKKAAHQSVDDLETKRRKVLESGAAPHALRTCSICNVVSLSVMDFNNHCVGQRHMDAIAALARKNGAGSSGASSHSLLNRRF